jgi:uncharacterized membrane protein HdeD (DUF308 family)
MMRELNVVRDQVTQNWWAVALRGAFAILFGILTIAWPQITVVVLVALFGAWALLDGISAFVAAWRSAEAKQTWWPFLLTGVLGVGAAIVTWVWPQITALSLLYVIAVWAIVSGVLQLAGAIRMRKVITNEFWLGLAGVAGIVFGVLALIYPGAGAIAITWAIGWYAIVVGFFFLMLGFRLRSMRPMATSSTTGTVPA